MGQTSMCINRTTDHQQPTPIGETAGASPKMANTLTGRRGPEPNTYGYASDQPARACGHQCRKLRENAKLRHRRLKRLYPSARAIPPRGQRDLRHAANQRKAAMIAMIWGTPRSSAHRRRVHQDKHVQPCEPYGERQDFHMGHASTCNNRAADHKQPTPTGETASASPKIWQTRQRDVWV